MSTRTLYPVSICPANELTPGCRKIVTIDSLPIVIVNMDNQLYAFLNMCPHQGAPLECGSISGVMMSPEPHQYEYGRHNEVVRCPLHGWGFDMKTGVSLFDPKLKIKTFQVKEENGSIVLLLKRQPADITIKDWQPVCS
ncbi:Rieske (2Fe-2S) protein [Bacillus sp. B190/17]|uniref:Rieske (2Fe-2S) protein n=1 Tax=Bacillus lumedeiriae TaxID=3058829 RepID=A0ABW8I9P8_9BACI